MSKAYICYFVSFSKAPLSSPNPKFKDFFPQEFNLLSVSDCMFITDVSTHLVIANNFLCTYVLGGVAITDLGELFLFTIVKMEGTDRTSGEII